MNPATRDKISQVTQDRVLAAVAELGYVPHQAARMLRQGHGTIVLIAFPYGPLRVPIIAETLDALARALSEAGYTPLLYPRWPVTREELAEACRNVHPVGVVAPAELLSTQFVQTLRTYGALGIIAVGERARPHVVSLVLDQKSVGRLAVEFLASVKHKRILMLAVNRADVAETRKLRVAGARAAGAELGVKVDVVDVALDAGSVADAIRTAFGRRQPPTGIYAFIDEIGIYALHALHDLGISVPGQVSVLGCDDTLAGASVQPALTTIEFRSPDIAGQPPMTIHQRWPAVVEMFHAMVEGRNTKRRLVLAHPAIVRRDSA